LYANNEEPKKAIEHQESYVSNLPNCKRRTFWRHNCFGTYKNRNGAKYIGEWKNNKRHGQGTLDLTSSGGIKYVGEWKYDNWHGQGIYTWANGKIQKGIFENGKFLYANNVEPKKKTIYIPPNAYASGSGWLCNKGYTKSGNYCLKEKQKIPPNAYVSGEGWLCNPGYTINVSGDRCYKKKQKIPPNAYASGSGWLCNSGYKKAGNKCVIDQEKLYSASSGSGFAVTSDGYVVTNYHVIKGCTDVKIHDKGRIVKATIVTYDPNNDIALLKGNFKPRKFYPLSTKTPGLLTEIWVAGHPFGKKISSSIKVTKGIVSSLSGLGNNFSNFQIDAAIQPGNSGGPIMNNKGNVVGVAVHKLNREKMIEKFGHTPELVNFGVKASVVRNIMDSESINLPTPYKEAKPQAELGKLITDGTYYLSCWMTIGQIEKMQEKKVMFSNFK